VSIVLVFGSNLYCFIAVFLLLQVKKNSRTFKDYILVFISKILVAIFLFQACHSLGQFAPNTRLYFFRRILESIWIHFEQKKNECNQMHADCISQCNL
jgi:hypothetical protein